ncbi:hypothetical protein A1O1_08368 [Capronia coronata CBS 617.96]|uniref:BTB domain-containing protein n=1 Tax=Capronia coronata CBS 617.96 TaxID=1182541 RepID=W9XTA3_9EURO|nr:uncharacterized protein A1O1_08368 [Capronia coronata CBS 617.96]EXJ80226.1 hypothetical protein A1O1_08368 [Capronia coronata CBS 617.96]
MPTLPGRRYGEPDWGNAEQGGLHSETHPALTSCTSSYEERRLAQYGKTHAAVPKGRRLASYPKPKDLINMTEMVRVIVGQEEQTWMLHRDLLTAVSDFAKAALSNPFEESQEQTIRLPEENPAIFAIFVSYLYTDSLYGSVLGDGKLFVDTLDADLALYMLADRLQDLVLCKHLVERLAFSYDRFTAEQIQYVLDNTAPSDPLRYACLQRVIREIQCRTAFLNGPLAAELYDNHAPEILAIMMGRFEELVIAPV